MNLSEQKALLEKVRSEGVFLELDAEMYLIPTRFYVSWCQWLDGKGYQPYHIEVKDLLHDDKRLKPRLMEKTDYEIICKELWEALSKWYFADATIMRKVTLTGVTQSDVSVEVNPLVLKVEYSSSTSDKQVEITLPRNLRTGNLKQEILSILDVKEKDVSITISQADSSIAPIDIEQDMLLYETGLSCHDIIVVRDNDHKHDAETDSKDDSDSDMKDCADTNKTTSLSLAESKFPGKGNTLGSASSSQYSTNYYGSSSSTYSSGSKSSYYKSSYYDDYYSSNSSNLSPSTIPGIVGLQNLGNTCFMNSGLQCLINTPDLRSFFMKNQYLADLNPNNPLGTGGFLAKEFAALIKSMWSGGSGSVAPRSFKSVLGKFASQFMGYQQHDSQELLAFVLDGLHEDLNRIKTKPYTEQIEQTTQDDDEEVARSSWENHLKRNQSIIVDLFHGQFRSRVDCGKCGKFSVTYDPFLYLPLHLPNSLSMSVTARLYRLDGTASLYDLNISKSATILDFKREIGKKVGIRASNIAAADVYRSRIYSLYSDKDELSDHCRTTSVIDCFELNEYEAGDETMIVHIQHVSSKVDYYGSRSCLEYPFVARVKRGDFTKETMEAFVRRIFPAHMMEVERSNLAEQPFHLMVTGTYASWEREWTVMEAGKVYSSGHVVCVWAEHLKPQLDKIQQPESSTPKANYERRGSVSLEECLKLFSTPETLTEDNLWYCPRCKEHLRATKQMDLWSLPKILVVQIKRFSYTKYFRDKLGRHFMI